MKHLNYIVLATVFLISSNLLAQITPSPNRGEGEDPFTQFIIRGVTLINGAGAPPTGPVDVVVKGNRITEIKPDVPINPDKRPKAKSGDKEIQAENMYLLPSLIGSHAHIGGTSNDQSTGKIWKVSKK